MSNPVTHVEKARDLLLKAEHELAQCSYREPITMFERVHRLERSMWAYLVAHPDSDASDEEA